MYVHKLESFYKTTLIIGAAALTQEMGEQTKLSFADGMPKCNGTYMECFVPTIIHSSCLFFSLRKMKTLDWTAFQPYFFFAHTIARITSIALAGPELCANEEWRTMMVTITLTLMQTAQQVRKKYSPQWRWVIPWVDPGAKEIYKIRKRCAELLASSYQSRLARKNSNGEPFLDGIQWLMDKSSDGKRDLLELADEQLFLSIASIHSSSASVLSIVYDLLERPEFIDEILEEIRSIRATSVSPGWTRKQLDELIKLDSFMKESQRFFPAGLGESTRQHHRILLKTNERLTIRDE